MIVTTTLNPMLDKTVYIGALQRGAIHRAEKMEMVAGGKGINVSRQLKCLGVKTIATGFLGGEVGEIVLGLMSAEGIGHDFVLTDAMTREGMTYLEPDGTWTAMFEPALRVDAASVDTLKTKIASLALQCTWLVCGGSSPGPEADDIFYEAITCAHRAGVPSVLDSYGNAFDRGLKALPTLVKPNRREFEATFHKTVETESQYIEAIDFLLNKGTRYCVITDGPKSFYAGLQGHYWKVTPPQVKSVNPTGSGDAMIAGILYGFRQGWKFERCLSFAAASGAANACKWDIANSSLEEITRLESEVVLRRI